MKVTASTSAVLLCAALLVDSTSAAARWEILKLHRQRQLLSSSVPASPALPSPTSPSPTLSSLASSSLSSPSTLPSSDSPPSVAPLASAPQSNASSLAQQSSAENLKTTLQPSTAPSRPTPSSSFSAPASSHDDDRTLDGQTASPSAQDSSGASTTAAPRPHSSHNGTNKPAVTSVTDTMPYPEPTSTSDSDASTSTCSDLDCTSDVMATKTESVSQETSTTTTEERFCTPFPFDKPLVQYSIVYTSTVTFWGNKTDYTPPYEPIKTPDYCTVINSSPSPVPAPTPEGSMAMGMGLEIGLPTPAPKLPALITPIVLMAPPDASKMHGGQVTVTLPPLPQVVPQVVTFITTEKNPAVVFPTEALPDYSPTFLTIGDSFNSGNHKTAESVDDQPEPTVSVGPLDTTKQPPKSTYSVIAGGNTVIINDKTLTGLRPDETTTVTVGRATFTVLPTAVEGMGSTVTKPPPLETRLPTPTSRVVGGVPVAVSGAKAVIGGTTVAVPWRTTTTTSIGGHDVVLGPGTLAVGSDTLTFIHSTPRPTDQVVSGGDVITAIGKSVIVLRSSTITYGPDIPASKTVIGGETVTIGPNGVVLHGTTLGGPSADATLTDLEVVGGFTVGRLPNSKVVVNGKTFALHPRGEPKTTEIDGETVTIENDGLVMSSTTIAYPADAYVTATIEASGTWVDAMPAETGPGGTVDHARAHGHKSAASRPSWGTKVLCLGAFASLMALF